MVFFGSQQVLKNKINICSNPGLASLPNLVQIWQVWQVKPEYARSVYTHKICLLDIKQPSLKTNLFQNNFLFGFRYNACHACNLNGYNYRSSPWNILGFGIVCESFMPYQNVQEQLAQVEMAIKGMLAFYVSF